MGGQRAGRRVEDARERWRVGALAGAAGLTVRTLHHYDGLGLLRPSLRTAAGHRLYTARDVRRLYRILALRKLGLSLEQIGRVLDTREGDWPAVVRGQLEQLDRQIAMETALRARLTSLLAALERMREPTTDSLIEIMEAMTMFERYYTPEQLAQLEQRRTVLGDDASKQAEQGWADLIEEAETARQENLDPASPAVQAIAQRWKELVAQFTGGDAGIRQSLQQMYETEGVENASHGMVSPEVMAFIGNAIAAGGGW